MLCLTASSFFSSVTRCIQRVHFSSNVPGDSVVNSLDHEEFKAINSMYTLTAHVYFENIWRVLQKCIRYYGDVLSKKKIRRILRIFYKHRVFEYQVLGSKMPKVNEYPR